MHELARQREYRSIEGHLCIDHVHMCIEIPPKRSVSEVVGYIKGKSAIQIARDVQGRPRNNDRSRLQADKISCRFERLIDQAPGFAGGV